MIRDLFINMTIIISFISIASQFLKKYELDGLSSMRIRIIAGCVTGLLGIMLMLFSVHIGESTIVDFRNVVIALTAILGGTAAALVAGLITAVFRITYFGVSLSSVVGVILVLIITTSSIIIAKLRIRQTEKWVYATVCNLILSSIALTILLKGKINVIHFLSIYWGATVVLTAIVAYYSNYCLIANKLYMKLQIEAKKDFLTGLNNVRSFDDLFNFAIKNAKEKKENLSLLMIDIDFFKKVNDTYGHAEGDIVLRELGKILSKSSRSFDIVSRNGGEEFTVLLLDCKKNHALEIAERIRLRVENHKFILSEGTEISITVSIGVASYPELTGNLEKLLEESDIALYAAKRTGRNRVCTDEVCTGSLLLSEEIASTLK